MSWNHTQEEYAEFIRIWNSSVSSCDALARLKVSPRFDTSRGWPRRDTRNYIQGVAGALRRRGVSLKRLVMEDANRAKPPIQDRHLNFQELCSLSNDT